MKVALYLRVSTQEQADEGYSIGEQEERLKNYCKAMQWTIFKIYVDPGYSGGNMDRPGLHDLIKDVESGVIDKVVVYKLDRLSRSQYDTLYLIEKVFLANDTDFVSMTESFSTNSSLGRAMIGFLSVFAQLEKDKINERTIMGKEARAKAGKWHGGAVEPIGYDYDSASDMLIVNEYEAMQVREIYELFLRGVPLRTAERILREKGYTHKHGNSWDPKTMRRVMRSKIYLGYIRHKGEWYPGDHDPIIDIETYDRAVKLLDNRAEQYKESGVRPGAQTTYLGGLLYCKQCGGKYAKNTWPRRDGSRKHIYGCYSRSKKMKQMIKDPNCKNKYWKMEELDRVVIDEIKKLALDTDYITKLQKERLATIDESSKIGILEKQIKNLDEQISRFMDLYGIGKFTIDQVSQKVDPLNEERSKLEKELNDLSADNAELTTEETIQIVKSFGDILDRGNFGEIRLVIESLIYKIELDNDDVTIHWKFI